MKVKGVAGELVPFAKNPSGNDKDPLSYKKAQKRIDHAQKFKPESSQMGIGGLYNHTQVLYF